MEMKREREREKETERKQTRKREREKEEKGDMRGYSHGTGGRDGRYGVRSIRGR